MATRPKTPYNEDLVMTSKHDSTCAHCKVSIQKGVTKITPRRIDGRQKWVHEHCGRSIAKTKDDDKYKSPDTTRKEGPIMETDQHGCMSCNPSNPKLSSYGCSECDGDSDDDQRMDATETDSWKDIDIDKIPNYDEIRKVVDTAIDECVLDLNTEDAKKHLDKKFNTKMDALSKKLTETVVNLTAKTVEGVAALKKDLQSWLEKREPRKLEIKLPKLPKQTLKGHQHVNFEEALEYALAAEPTMLVGPTGCGKSWLCKQLADTLKRKYYFVSCSAGMSEGQVSVRQLPAQPSPAMIKFRVDAMMKKGFSQTQAITLSSSSGMFIEQISQYVEAYENGGVFLLDEADNADPNVLVFINASVDGNGLMALPNRPSKPFAKRHKDFHLIMACNTYGRGADRLYVGRTQMDEATIDRFRFGTIEMNYDKVLEEKLCPDDDLRNRLWGYRDGIERNRLERVLSTRFMEKAHVWKNVYKKRTDEQIDEKVFLGWSEDEVMMAKSEARR